MERLTTEAREAILAPPTGRVTIVLDTDTKNEIDDQFAVIYALLSERIDCRAIYAAPFANRHYATAAEGQPTTYGVRVGTIQQREQFIPRKQIWARSALDWVDDIADIPRIEKEAE